MEEFKEIMLDAYMHIELANKDTKPYFTGFETLDSSIGKVKAGSIVIIGGRPAMGKTAFCTQIILNHTLQKDNPVAIYSFGISKEMLVKRILSTHAEIDTVRVNTGHMYSEDWIKLASTMSTLYDLPVFIEDKIPDICEPLATSFFQKVNEINGLKYIFIDDLDLILNPQYTNNTYESIQDFAKTTGVTVFITSNISRKLEYKKDKKPLLTDLEVVKLNCADLVLFIHRKDGGKSNKQGNTEIIIAKNRFGNTETINFNFDACYMKFREI